MTPLFSFWKTRKQQKKKKKTRFLHSLSFIIRDLFNFFLPLFLSLSLFLSFPDRSIFTLSPYPQYHLQSCCVVLVRRVLWSSHHCHFHLCLSKLDTTLHIAPCFRFISNGKTKCFRGYVVNLILLYSTRQFFSFLLCNSKGNWWGWGTIPCSYSFRHVKLYLEQFFAHVLERFAVCFLVP